MIEIKVNFIRYNMPRLDINALGSFAICKIIILECLYAKRRPISSIYVIHNEAYNVVFMIWPS